MLLITLVAVVACPLALRRAGIDPALAWGRISTTVAGISGFALTLSLVGFAA